jgi:histidinol-phosphate/aromatic aminotransferase/cobyric acid decarboxylase-like protein
MNFRDFVSHRANLLAENPSLIDLAETDICKAFAGIIPRPLEQPGRQVHRCDLAKSWVRLHGLPQTLSRQALISCGVRHSLSLLFSALAKEELALRIPSDVYPAYGELARVAGVKYATFPTIPKLLLPEDGDWLLLPNPLKPLGRWLDANEVASLVVWLSVHRRRRLVLDAVYNFELSLHPTTQALFAEGQAVVLHSLSKAWLHPKLLGIALVPESDVDALTPIFRDNSPPFDHLSKAGALFDDHQALPGTVSALIAQRTACFFARIPSKIAPLCVYPLTAQAPGYFVLVNADPAQLLERHRLLTLPLTVFGSRFTDYSVVSTLTVKDDAPQPSI